MHHVDTNLSMVKKKNYSWTDYPTVILFIQIQILDFEVKVQGKMSLTRAYDPMFYNQTHRNQIS